MNSTPFIIKDCALAAIATGMHAGSLIDLRDMLLTVDVSCIYYHFWGGKLRPSFVHPIQHNDFAAWAYHHLHEEALAEKLNILNPTSFESLELLRQAMVRIIEDCLDKMNVVIWTQKSGYFHFTHSKLIVFNTGRSILSIPDLLSAIEKMSEGSIFYHFIDARRRQEFGLDDFSAWLKNGGPVYDGLIAKIAAIDIYFLSLAELKGLLIDILSEHQS